MNLTVMKDGQNIDQFTANTAEEAREYVLARFGEVLTVVDNDNKVIVRPYNFELKNVKYAAFASEETHCFEATLYVNGKRFCTVSNEGHGGENRYHGVKGGIPQNEVWKQIKEINRALKNEKLESEYFPDGLENDLEIEVGNLMNRWHLVNDVKKLTRKICYTKGDDTKDIFVLPSKFKPTLKNLEAVKNSDWWKKDFRMVNEMSVDEILTLDYFSDVA